MIHLTRDHLRQIADAAEAAYPKECCGLLVGRHGDGDALEVREIHPSANLAPCGHDRFEVDPKLILDLQRHLRDGPDQVIGLYHSHPDHPARPSKTDLEGAWQPELVWLIVAVERGRAIHTTAHRLVADGSRFEEITLHTESPRR